MKYITFIGDVSESLKTDYNTVRFSESDLQRLCDAWSLIDGILYFVVDYE